MLRQIKGFILVAVMTGVLMGCSATALAYDCQEWLHNDSGETAHDLTKILKGKHTIERTYPGNKFKDVEVEYHSQQDITSVHFSGGTVEHCSWTDACFNTKEGPPVEVIHAFWTDEYGQKIGNVVGVGTNAYDSDGDVVVEVIHEWVDWTGTGYPIEPNDGPGAPMGPITITDVRYAITDTVRPLEDLNNDLLDPNLTPELTWVDVNGVTLNYGQSMPYNLGPLEASSVVLFRFMATGEGHESVEMIQYREPIIPTVSEWGLIVMAVLLLTAGAFVIVQRRRRVAA